MKIKLDIEVLTNPSGVKRASAMTSSLSKKYASKVTVDKNKLKT